MSSILVLGISPGFAGSREKSKTVQRVKRWMAESDLSEQDYDWLNVSDEPGSNPSLNQIKLQSSVVQVYNKVVCLGKTPGKWCKKMGIDHLEVPHPSGINRVWNNTEAEPNVIEELKEYLKS